ncbi:MAG: arginine repressor [Lachnospiraceae bacterium]
MKNERHQAIASLIEQYQIATQEELAEKLNEAGYHVTQATVSRDIRQMKLVKTSVNGGKSCYRMQMEETALNGAYGSALKESLVSIDVAMNLLVLKTHPGMAMAVAAAVDALHFGEIVGTIAGDDTVMVAIRSVEDALIVQKRLQEMLMS